jgi:hypothetical protein
MELFLPGLIVLILAALFAFFIIPRTGSMILAVVCMIAVIAAGIHHYNTFYSEYQLSTWQNGLKENAIFIILGLAILSIIGSIFFMFSGPSTPSAETPMEMVQNAVVNAVQNMPPANTATNPLTAAVNTGIKNTLAAIGSVTNAAGAAVSGVRNAAEAAVSGVTNAAKQATNVITGPGANALNKKPSPLIPGTNFKASEI